ncbi:MAG: glycosyltransferase family 2 protein [Saprospiraceae bacterium]|nr:glycosyltransferase family 2 protein [Saprospiraceae bacterium]
MKLISIVIPVYNSAETMRELCSRIDSSMRADGYDYELILVDDNSSDNSWELIRELNDAYPIRAYRFIKNYGQHYALKCGIDHSMGDIVITMDDDLQNPPEEVIKLIKELEENDDLDVVIGSYHKKRHNIFRNMGTSLQRSIRKHTFPGAPLLQMTSFRGIKKRIADHIKDTMHVNPRIGLIILSLTNRITNVEVEHLPRKAGRTQYTLRKMIKNTLDNIINYSSFPLRLVSYMGVITALLSFLLAVFYLVRYFMGSVTVSGFSTLIIVMLFSTGLILFSFGIVGEYLGRIVSQQLMSKQYRIRERVGEGETN